MKNSLAGVNEPFTPSWYADHPNAWQYTHPHADFWAVTGIVGLSTWLGVSVAAGSNSGTTAVVATESTAGETATDEGTQTASAAEEIPDDLEWMPLGVFNAAEENAARSTLFLQLAVSRDGVLKGNAYDTTSDTTTPIGGTIDKESRAASWRIGAKGAEFEATLDGLVAESCTAKVTSPGGRQETWHLVHVQKPSN
jgi:hypothetical protein